HSTPARPPTHHHHHLHNSRDSFTARFSPTPGTRKVSLNYGVTGADRHRDDMPWRDTPAIEEESLLRDGEQEEKRLPRRFYVLAFVAVFLVLFFLFALVLWGASHHQSPQVTMNSITFEDFYVQAGTDSSLVPTDLLTLNSTVKLTYRNAGSFFGVHVTSTPVLLDYYQLAIASGSIDYFYQSRKSQRNLYVAVMSSKLPLYGGGSGLSGRPNGPPVNLTLSFTVRSRAYVLGKLVKPKFYSHVLCAVVMDQTRLNTPVSLKNSCQYS
ncbi:hypothetical protein B296_00038532, partial [Ensete ventricosum]